MKVYLFPYNLLVAKLTYLIITFHKGAAIDASTIFKHTKNLLEAFTWTSSRFGSRTHA